MNCNVLLLRALVKFQNSPDRVEMIRKQLAEAEKQLYSSRQKLETLRHEEQECLEKQRVFTGKAEELRKFCDLYRGELDKTRSVMNQLSSKLKEHRSVSCLSQEEVLLFLQELEIPKPIKESFKANQIGGKALQLVTDRNLRELGMSNINHRKGLLHAICNVLENGCIHVAPPPRAYGDGLIAWWSAEEVWKWLEEQGFSFPCLKGMTGRTLIHLSDEDISQFGLPMGPALELKAKCETLKQSFFYCSKQQQQSEGEHNFLLLGLCSSDLFTVVPSNFHADSGKSATQGCVPSDCTPEFLCPIAQEIMREPVIASDGCV